MAKPFRVTVQGVDENGTYYVTGIPEDLFFGTAIVAVECAKRLSMELSVITYVGCDARDFLEFYQGQVICQRSWEDFYVGAWSDDFVELFTTVAKLNLGTFSRVIDPTVIYPQTQPKEG